MEKTIITVAPVGAEITREDTPYLPLTPDEIVAEALEAHQAGAAILHLHVRDEKGQATQNPVIFAQIINKVREECDMIIQVSTGGAVGMTAEERLGPLETAPEMATLSTGTVNFGQDVFMNSYPMIETFARKMQEKSVVPEIEIFDTGMLTTAKMLIKKGLLSQKSHFDMVLGVPGGMSADPASLLFLVERLPQGSTWTVAGIGRHELPLSALAIVMGGHVRVGFEDNIYYQKGELAKSNTQLVKRVARLSKELGREVATPAEARKILGLAGGE